MKKNQIINRFLFSNNSYLLNIKIPTNAKNKQFIFCRQTSRNKNKVVWKHIFFTYRKFFVVSIIIMNQDLIVFKINYQKWDVPNYKICVFLAWQDQMWSTKIITKLNNVRYAASTKIRKIYTWNVFFYLFIFYLLFFFKFLVDRQSVSTCSLQLLRLK